MRTHTFGKLATALALAGLSVVSTTASAFAVVQPTLSVAYSEGCSTGSDDLGATNSNSNLGITVTGLISLETTSSCTATWRSTQTITVGTDGYYFFGFNYDYNYEHSANSSGTAHFEFGGKLLEPPGLNLSTGFDFDVHGNGETSGGFSGGSTATDDFVYPYGNFVAAGTYTLEQTGLLSITSDLEGSADVAFHIPTSTYLLNAPGPNQAPEPTGMALFGLALLAMGAQRKNSRRTLRALS